MKTLRLPSGPATAVAIVCSAATLVASDLPRLTVPEGVGVNIHFTRGHEQDLDLIAAAGFKVARMDFGWAGIERAKGQYDWSAYDELTANLAKRGLRALYILDYSNPLYEESVVTRNPVSGEEHRDTASPQHPESVAAFARWAAAAAERYRGRRVIWEIWNEPNITFWKPKPAWPSRTRWLWPPAAPSAPWTPRPRSSGRPRPRSRCRSSNSTSPPASSSTSTP